MSSALEFERLVQRASGDALNLDFGAFVKKLARRGELLQLRFADARPSSTEGRPFLGRPRLLGRPRSAEFDVCHGLRDSDGRCAPRAHTGLFEDRGTSQVNSSEY